MSKTNNNAISNEEIIAALIQHGTIKAAAHAIGTTSRTLYGRMSQPEFRAEYMEAKNDLLRQAVCGFNSKLSAAVETIAEIMTDKEVKPAVRLQAAQTIINSLERFTQRLTADERASNNEATDPLNGLI